MVSSRDQKPAVSGKSRVAVDLEEYRRAEEIEAALTGRGVFVMRDGKSPKYIGQCGGLELDSEGRVRVEWLDDRLAEWAQRGYSTGAAPDAWVRFCVDGKIAYDLADVRVESVRFERPDMFSHLEEGYGRSPVFRLRPTKVDCTISFSHYDVRQLEDDD